MGAFEIISLLVTVIVALVVYLVKRQYSYWKDMGAPYEEPLMFYGSMKGVGTKLHLREILGRVYHKFKSLESPFVGIYFYMSPVVLATSLDFIKSVLVRDAAYFTDRGAYYNEIDDPLSAHLFNIDNPRWKELRTKLTPTFTSGKMKMMFNTVCDVGEKLVKTLGIEADACVNNEIEIKDIMARFTTDVIGSCSFGLDCSSLEDPKSFFRINAKKAFDDPKYRPASMQLILMFKDLARKLHISATRKEVSDFFFQVVKDTVSYREKNNVNRNDFMQLLIQLKNKGKLDEGETVNIGKLTIEEVAAQAFIFFLAGFETSSTNMCYVLFELSQNKAVQDKARDCVKKVLAKHNGLFTYEALCEMDYLENCISESLRKYPPVVNLTRSCTKDYQVEGTNFVIKKGQMVFIPAFVIQNDPDIYPNPTVFDPDRFSPEEQAKRSPYAFMSFGLGPRNCIGLRFGILQAKIGLAMLLNNFKFESGSRSVAPIKFAKNVFMLSPEGGVYLKVTKI